MRRRHDVHCGRIVGRMVRDMVEVVLCIQYLLLAPNVRLEMLSASPFVHVLAEPSFGLSFRLSTPIKLVYSQHITHSQEPIALVSLLLYAMVINMAIPIHPSP